MIYIGTITFLFISASLCSVAESTSFAELASALESVLGCSDDTVLADEINRISGRGFDVGDGFCPGYLDLVDASSRRNLDFFDDIGDLVGDIGDAFDDIGDEAATAVAISVLTATCSANASAKMTETTTTLGGCEITVHECTGTSLAKVIEGDADCYEELEENAQAVRAAFTSEQQFTSTTCEDQTAEIEDNSDILTAFLAYTIQESDHTIDGETTEFAQYASTDNDYEVQCASNSGSMKVLNINATCKGWASSGDPSTEINLIVGSRPRCYGIDCTDEEDESRLFEAYTLRLTESEWMEEDSSIFWVCQGEFVDAASDATGSSACKVETDVIVEIASVRSTYAAMDEPDSVQNQQQLLGFLWKVDIAGEYIVSYNNGTSDAYGSECTENGGEFDIEDAFVVKCESENGDSLQYQLSGFPMCSGQTCGGTVSSEIREAVVQDIARERLGIADSWSCTTTSGAPSKLLTVLIPLLFAFTVSWLV